MNFQEKIRLTKDVLPKDYNYGLEVVPTNPKFLINYRNKTVQDILQPISPASRKVLSLKHIEIIEFLQSLNPPTPIISIAIKNNYLFQYQLKFTIPYEITANLAYLNYIIEEIQQHTMVNVVSGYYQIKYPNKPKPSKFEKYYHFYGDIKLLEEMDGNIIELSPNSFCRVNYHISKHLYHRVFLLIQQLTQNFTTSQNLVCFGRDINFPIEYYNTHFREVFGITHCPLVHKDIKPKDNLILTFTRKPEYIKNFQAYFNENPDDKYLILVTAGRNGLSTDLMKYLTKSPQVTDIVYIACGRESLRKNIDENDDMIIKRVILMDEFPNTNSNNSIVHFQKKLISIPSTN